MLPGITSKRDEQHGLKYKLWDFPDGPVVKHPPASTRDTSLILGPVRLYMFQDNKTCGPQLSSLHA